MHVFAFLLALIGSIGAVCLNNRDFAHCVSLTTTFNSDYYFSTNTMTLVDAVRFCEIEHRKHLVFFETQHEQATLKDTIVADNGYVPPDFLREPYWIGSVVLNMRSYWTYWTKMKGKEMDYTSWQNGYESKAAGKVDFMVGWFKVDPEESFRVICEEESNMAEVLKSLQPYPTTNTTQLVPTTTTSISETIEPRASTTPANTLGTEGPHASTTPTNTLGAAGPNALKTPAKGRRVLRQTASIPKLSLTQSTRTGFLCPSRSSTVQNFLTKLTSHVVDCDWTLHSSSLTQCAAGCLAVGDCCGFAYTLTDGQCCGLAQQKTRESLRVDCDTDICYTFVEE